MRSSGVRTLVGVLPLLLPGLVSCPIEPAVPPNIVLIISDDQGYDDYGFMGSDFVHTPNLDSLADRGVVFTHGFDTASTCRPSLQTLLTGLEPLQFDFRVERLRRRGLPSAELYVVAALETLPRQLATRGYVSFQGGKYWEGSFQVGGFDEGTATGVSAGSIDERGLLGAMSGGEGTALGRQTMQPLFDFIDRNAAGPFFVWFAPMLPHLPHNPSLRHKRPYVARSDLDHGQQRYYGNITRLDERIGDLLGHLDARGLRERTVVIFLADNGWQQPAGGRAPTPRLGGDRGKLSIYEHGFRTPIVIDWPGHAKAGRRDDRLVSTVDLYPTILEIAGVDSTSETRTGISLVSALESGNGPRRERLIGGVSRLRQDTAAGLPLDDTAKPERAYFLRDLRWRYVWYPERGVEELYEITTDPWEQRDEIDAHRGLADDFKRDVVAWAARMTALPDRGAEAR